MVTGASAEESGGAEATKLPTQPTVILVGDSGGAGEGFDKLQNVVFKAENVALAMKAFRTIRMAPSDVEDDGLLADQGEEVPRLLVWDPVKAKVTVLEKGKLTAGSVFGTLKKISDAYYEENLEKTVKSHLKLLTERDQVANREKMLREKSERLEAEKEKDKKAEKELAELAKELEEVTKELEAMAVKEREIWKLTPKTKAA